MPLNWTEELKKKYPEAYASDMANPDGFANQPLRDPNKPIEWIPRDQMPPIEGDLLDTQAEANVFVFNRPTNNDA